VWEEMALVWNLTLGDDVVVQTWQGGNAIADVTANGHKVIAGDYNFWASGLYMILLQMLTCHPVSGLWQRPMA